MTNLVTNYGAENGNTGWSGLAAYDVDRSPTWNNQWGIAMTQEGVGCVHTGNNAFITKSSTLVSMSQDFSTVPGTLYSVSFYAADASSNNVLILYIGSIAVITINGVPANPGQIYTATFTANNNIESIVLTGQTSGLGAGICIDDISVSFVSSPAPTNKPSNTPTNIPTTTPTFVPSNEPTTLPTTAPTYIPSSAPTKAPSNEPTESPSTSPSETNCRNSILNCAKDGILGRSELTDWNKDAYMDVACTHYDGTIEYFQGNGSGVLKAGVILTTQSCDLDHMV